MHVGMSVVFQNPGRTREDHEVWRDELALADLAEPLGFDSVWTVEHHFTDYMLAPSPMQFLTWMAARTARVQLGTMVAVLPWQDPLRLAEQVSVLDIVSDGRLILGIGRGAALVEFEGFRVPMDESRPRFTESAELLLEGLERGWVEHDGDFIRQPKRKIRPAPVRSFRGRCYAATVSPDSIPILARLGVGLLIIPQKPWPEVEKELGAYRAHFRDMNGEDPPAPIVAGWTFVDEDAGRAAAMAHEYIGGYIRTVLDHYQFAERHLATTKGYEYYGKIADKIAEFGEDKFVEFFLNLQVYGTPDQCCERIVEVRERVGSDSFIGVFSYAGLPPDEAERNMRLFAAEVMPRLKELPDVATARRDVA